MNSDFFYLHYICFFSKKKTCIVFSVRIYKHRCLFFYSILDRDRKLIKTFPSHRLSLATKCYKFQINSI